jgi:16S rRNA (adenine1518-N6/adenine1519-N6)-dimethyltransferase
MSTIPGSLSPFSAIPPLDVAALLKKLRLRADKKLGQNFLQDPGALEKITAAADIDQSDTVLEIGAGLGSLTRYLAVSAREVFAVEVDRQLTRLLPALLDGYPNVRVIEGDILKLSPAQIGLPSNYLVVANIPYHITSAIIRHLLEAQPKPRRIVLTVQKEIAERICEDPPDMSLLALSVQVYGRPRIEAVIRSGAFYPAPKVDSAVVRIDIYTHSLIPKGQLDNFFRLIKAGFSQKRKTLRNSLSGGLRISREQTEALLGAASIDPGRRAETLNLEEWGRLSKLDDPRKTRNA